MPSYLKLMLVSTAFVLVLISPGQATLTPSSTEATLTGSPAEGTCPLGEGGCESMLQKSVSHAKNNKQPVGNLQEDSPGSEGAQSLQTSVVELKASGPPMNAGTTAKPTRFPWTKECTEGQTKAYVDASKGKDWKRWGDSEDKPAKTIDFAVSKYSGTCTTIYIKAGTYTNKGYKGNANKNKNNKNKIADFHGITNLIVRNFGGADGTGIGGDKVLLKFDGPGGFIGGSAKDDAKTVKNVEIFGLEIEGPNQDITYEDAIADRLTQSSYYTGRGIAFWKAERVHIHHMLVHDTPSAGIRVDNSDYVVLEDNEVYHATWWASSAESGIVVAQSINIDDEEGIKVILRRNKVYDNMNRIPYYNKKYAWDYSPIGSTVCGDEPACESESVSGCPASGCECPYTCRYGKNTQDFIIDGMGVYVSRNSDTYLKGMMEMSDNICFRNGINGLVYHRTFRGFVKNNIIFDNGQVPKTGHDEDIKEATAWMKPLSRTRQPYSGLVFNNADGVKVYGNKVRARYDDDFAFTMEVDKGKDYAPKAGGNNKVCKGKVDSNFDPYVSEGSTAQCDSYFEGHESSSPSM